MGEKKRTHFNNSNSIFKKKLLILSPFLSLLFSILALRLIRNIDIAKGSSIKKPTPSELINKKMVRKSIVAIKKIKKGEIFDKTNIFIKRPAIGISPMKFFQILGKKAKKEYKIDDLI